MKSRWMWLAAILALVGGIFFVYRRHRHPVGPFNTSFWYWQTPYTLSDDDVKNLQKLDVKQLFVRAGTFSSDGQNIVLTIPQKYGPGANKLPIHLVFNADGGVIRHFENYDVSLISGQISSRIAAQVDVARKSGVTVIGVQLDFDVPTRLLPRYADLVSRIRKSNPLFRRQKGFYVSLTGLMSWLGTRGVERLSDEVDFMIPQAYEGMTGQTPDQMRPVFDPDDTQRRLPAAERLNCPYWVGIPSYGHAFLYDDHDHLLGTYRGLEAQDALRHPSFQLLDAYPANRDGKRANNEKEWVGEEILKFKAVRPAPSGYGLNFTLAYSLPSPSGTVRALNEVRRKRGANCLGVVIYRMPEAGSSFTSPLATLIEAGKTGGEIAENPRLDLKVTRSQDAYSAIESGSNKVPVDLFVEASNPTIWPSFVAPNAVEIVLTVDKPGFDDDLRLRTFDRFEFRSTNDAGQETVCAPRFANTIYLYKGFLDAGQKISAGPIRLLASGDVKVKIKTHILARSGFRSIDSTIENEVPKTPSKNP